MQLIDDVADRVAIEVLKLVDETGNLDIIEEVKKVIGTSSQTLEEAYMTAVRVRRAETRAMELIASLRAEHGGG
jgi:ABC-type molybdenum transport system ATPase subunit/photorepair protein PhrA